MNRQQLREHLLRQRERLSAAERERAAADLGDRLLALPELQHAETVGSYHSIRAELPTHALNLELAQNHRLALPVLHPVVPGHLLFLRQHERTIWSANRFGIGEPALRCPDIIPLQQIQILLVPLVGFDTMGNRLGMGGGYYDRTLASWRKGKYPGLLPIGLAYDLQRADAIPCAAWDVPLPMVITPAKVWDFRP
ncbi:5-formyltetrahydrofolate cyclo-ligase [Pseudidiomarina sp.]|uniref:5-formyltetrahydrofolate cyclo-ligase n=1 Tax=Pseudidiomarina sp. TaxID=2081707 RepID=UPI00299D6318|nr:5-formyltetrahydrofolate cyclo-ligase [Pseudidiomarina sp.]MDX1705638.1 5-formyltetrahydrofolate cyclo-ligase [Pseudidiomarina sp.]